MGSGYECGKSTHSLRSMLCVQSKKVNSGRLTMAPRTESTSKNKLDRSSTQLKKMPSCCSVRLPARTRKWMGKKKRRKKNKSQMMVIIVQWGRTVQ